jgi:hypothetical protein
LKPPAVINVDFDIAEENAVKAVFPSGSTRVLGDPFHFLQANKRWAKTNRILQSLPDLEHYLSAMLWAEEEAIFLEAKGYMFDRYSAQEGY